MASMLAVSVLAILLTRAAPMSFELGSVTQGPAALAPIASGHGSRGSDELDVVRVVTWNVEWLFDHDQSDQRSKVAKEQSPPRARDWKWKRDRVAEVLSKLKPTIVCLQEIEDRDVLFQLTTQLQQRHGLQYRYAFIEGYDFGTEQDVGILYRSGLVEYSRREQTEAMRASDEYYGLSKHLFARFEWTRGGQPESLWLLNVHLRARAEHADLRQRQARTIREWIGPALANGENVMVAGDFNIKDDFGRETPGGEVSILRNLMTDGRHGDMADAHQALDPMMRATHLSGRQFDRILYSEGLGQDDPNRVDLVFSGAQVISELVIQGEVDRQHWKDYWQMSDQERDISDHYPVVVDFEFR